MEKIKIHFQDWGQDLLWLEVDLSNGICTGAGPFHNSLYMGIYIFCPKSLYPGMYVDYSSIEITEIHQQLDTFKYKIASIEQL